MDTILLIVGILGFGAIVISIYVFMVAARNNAPNTHGHEKLNGTSAKKSFIERNPNDRRKNFQFDFPTTINGMLIPMERRTMLDRRSNPG